MYLPSLSHLNLDTYEPQRQERYLLTCATNKELRSLIIVVRLVKLFLLAYPMYANAQADLNRLV